MDALPYALRAQVVHGGPGRAEEEIGAAIRQHTVDLLRHVPVEAAQAGLNVGQAEAKLGGDQRPCQGGVSVPVDEHGVGHSRGCEGLQGQHDSSGLLGVAA